MKKAAIFYYQEQLDVVSRHFWEWDFDAMAEHVAFPHVVVTLDAFVRVETKEQYVIGTRAHREQIDKLGATEFFRTCIEAMFVPGRDDVITGAHSTHALRAGTPVMNTVMSQGTLVLRNGHWLSQNFISDYPERLDGFWEWMEQREDL